MNGKRAFQDTNCENCGNFIAQSEPIYFAAKERLCIDCAEAQGLVCACGDQKKPGFAECYGCFTTKK